jgi:hypothetical protein
MGLIEAVSRISDRRMPVSRPQRLDSNVICFASPKSINFTGNLAAVSGAHIWAPLPLQQLPPLPSAFSYSQDLVTL